MKIKELMIPNPITVTARASIEEAIELMKVNSIRHLPVVAADGSLAGLVTLSDLKQGLIPSLVGDICLADLMIKDPIVVSPEDDIEKAARLIYRHKIGGLPVVKKGKVVGIITGTDMLRAFIDMMGILSTSSRIDVVIGEKPGGVKKAMQIISDHSGDIMSVGITAQQADNRTYSFRLSACKTDGIRTALEKAGFTVEFAVD
jgi:acetoin utilization protein AcuB